MPINIEIMQGDLTKLEVDAIVNAANSRLQHGGGVAAAISRAGGPSIQKESDEIGHVEVGRAVHTSAGDLPARWVIHTVGPRMGEGDEERKLRSAIRSSLELAEELGASSVAFPAISTGIYGYPKDEAAPAMLDEARKVARTLDRMQRIIFCLFDEESRVVFEEAFEELEK